MAVKAIFKARILPCFCFFGEGRRYSAPRGWSSLMFVEGSEGRPLGILSEYSSESGLSKNSRNSFTVLGKVKTTTIIVLVVVLIFKFGKRIEGRRKKRRKPGDKANQFAGQTRGHTRSQRHTRPRWQWRRSSPTMILEMLVRLSIFWTSKLREKKQLKMMVLSMTTACKTRPRYDLFLADSHNRTFN